MFHFSQPIWPRCWGACGLWCSFLVLKHDKKINKTKIVNLFQIHQQQQHPLSTLPLTTSPATKTRNNECHTKQKKQSKKHENQPEHKTKYSHDQTKTIILQCHSHPLADANSGWSVAGNAESQSDWEKWKEKRKGNGKIQNSNGKNKIIVLFFESFVSYCTTKRLAVIVADFAVISDEIDMSERGVHAAALVPVIST